MADPWEQPSAAELIEEIELNEAMLQSLDGDAEDSESEMNRSSILQVIQGHRETLQRIRPIPAWGNQEQSDGGGYNADDSTASHTPLPAVRRYSNSSSNHSPVLKAYSDSSASAQSGNFLDFDANSDPRRLSLPSRKRLRDSDFWADEDEYPATKSRRPSPSPGLSAAASSTNSLDLDDPTIRHLLGSDIEEDYRDFREQQKEIEERRRQEKDDEKFARSLQESWNQPKPYTPQSSSASQSTIDPRKGSFSMPPPPKPTVKSEKQIPSYSALPGSYPANDLPDPLELDDSDSDLEEISPAAFSPYANRRPGGGSRTMGGPSQSFPDGMSAGYPYASMSTGGMPVYGSSYGTPTGPSSNGAYSLIDESIASYGNRVQDHGTSPAYYGGGISTGLQSELLGRMTESQLGRYNHYRESMYADPTKTAEELKELFKHIRPDEELRPEDRDATPEQMIHPLYEHQKLGLTWMRKMEEGSNKGGILADDMGLGKTIQALALILARPSTDRSRKTTLIVAPVALMQQWKREIQSKIRPGRHQLTVQIVHGDTRDTKWEVLKGKDIVLTTYGVLASELKRKLTWDERLKNHPNAKPSGKQDHLPLMGEKSLWYRIILDESQWIKNKSAKASIGACYLQSEYRWCMSGTPMQNNVEELFAMIKFLRIRPYNQAEKFSSDFTKPLKRNDEELKNRAMRQLQILLKAMLLRRTKMSEIDGRPILQGLPPKSTQEQRAIFSSDERDFYVALENQTQLTFNKYLKAGTVGRNYSAVLVLLLRLRQACCHPHLIKDFAINTGAPTDIDMVANARELAADVVERLMQIDAFECPVCLDAALNPLIFSLCGHTLCEDCLTRMIDDSLNAGNGPEGGSPDVKCPHCRAKIDTAKVTNLASFKKVHDKTLDEDGLDEDAETASESESEDDSDDNEEDEDDESDDLTDFVVPDDYDEYDPESSKEGPRKGRIPSKKYKTHRQEKSEKKRRKEKGKGKVSPSKHKSLAQLRTEGLKSKFAKQKYLRRLEENWQTSAKIEKTMELLEEIHARGRENSQDQEKTIIFSGFTSFLDLLEVPISRKAEYGSYARYDGSMNAHQRNEACLKFTDDPRCTIMLVSLKAGNSGLNLTAASQVIILDPHWNGYVEAQAIDRAHRIGQKRVVQVHRVLIDSSGSGKMAGKEVPGTVEDRILALQEKKRELVESALDENAAKNVGKLGTRELGYLFGVNSMT